MLMLLNLDHVKKLLKEKGWSYRELSKQSGISIATVSRVMAGKRGAGACTLAGIRRAFPSEPSEKLFFLT